MGLVCGLDLNAANCGSRLSARSGGECGFGGRSERNLGSFLLCGELTRLAESQQVLAAAAAAASW